MGNNNSDKQRATLSNLLPTSSQNNHLFLISSLMLLLLFSPMAYGFTDANNNSCSAIATDYDSVDLTGVNTTFSGDYDINDVTLLSHRVYTVMFVDMMWNTDGAGNPDIRAQDNGGGLGSDLQQLYGDGTPPNFNYRDGGSWLDSGINSDELIKRNISITFDMLNNDTNITVHAPTTKQRLDDKAYRVNLNLGELYVGIGSGRVSWSGLYTWNGTDCPGALPPAPTGTSGLTVNVTHAFDSTPLSNFSIQYQTANAGDTIYNDSGIGFAFLDNITHGIVDLNITSGGFFNISRQLTLGILTEADANTSHIFHFNNDSRFGETTTSSVDYFGNATATHLGEFFEGYQGDGGFIQEQGASSYTTLDNIQLGQEGTISMWIKPTSITANDRIFDNEIDGGVGSGIHFRNTNAVRLRLDTDGGNCLAQSPNNVVSVGTWYNVAMTWNGSTCRMYVNGYVVKGTTYAGSVLWNDTKSFIGKDGTANSLFFNGSMDEFVVWNRDLTQQEMLEYYTSHTIENKSSFPNISFKMEQAYLTVNTFEFISGYRINSFNVSVGDITETTSNGSINMNLSTSYDTASFDAFSYFPSSITQTFQNLTSNNINFNVTGFRLNVSVNSVETPLTNNFTIFLNRTTQDFIHSETVATTTGIASFDLLNGSYNITLIDSDTLAYTSEIVNITTQYTQYNLSTLIKNTFNITFRDSLTLDIIDYENITIEFISDAQSYNASTTNGTLKALLLIPSSYTFRYYGDSYGQQFSFYELVANSYQSVTLYLLNASDTTNITAKVIDETNAPVESAFIQVLRYNLATNSFLLQETVETNFDGEATLHLQLNSEYYKFVILYDGEIKSQTEKTYVTSTSLTFPIILSEAIGESYFNYFNIDFSLDYNNDTNTFAYFYNDGTGLTTEACLNIYFKSTGNGYNLIQSQCSASSSGLISLAITPNNGTFRADATVTQDGTLSTLINKYAVFRAEYPFTRDTMFWVIALTLLFASFSTFSIPLGFILTPMPLVMFSWLGLIQLPLWVAVGVLLMGVMFAYIVRKK